MSENVTRVVIWFSAGVTSAVAAYIAAKKYSGIIPVHLVNTDTGSEDSDNYRFMRDVSTWIKIPLEIIRSEKYADTFAVYDSTKFFKNRHGAKCTTELKKMPRQKYENLETDLQVFGYDAGEKKRADLMRRNNPEMRVWFPLIDEGITKSDARIFLLNHGIVEPRTYAEGFRNANCLARGCVKGGMGYWNHIRKMRPNVFWNMAKKEREIGYALLTYEKDGKKIPIYLDELPPDWGNYNAEPNIQCGLFCGLYDDD